MPASAWVKIKCFIKTIMARHRSTHRTCCKNIKGYTEELDDRSLRSVIASVGLRSSCEETTDQKRMPVKTHLIQSSNSNCFACVSKDVYVHVWAGAHACVCVAVRDSLGCQSSGAIYLDRISHWHWTHLLAQAGWLVSSRDPPASTCPELGLTMHANMPAFFHIMCIELILMLAR